MYHNTLYWLYFWQVKGNEGTDEDDEEQDEDDEVDDAWDSLLFS